MKYTFYSLLFACCFFGLAACNNSKNTKELDKNYQRKIYLTEEDYMADLSEHADAQRREAKPNVESEYIFELQPETQKNVYFFDERVQPMVPGTPSEREYKNTKRLWEKPKRYSPDQYYGDQAVPAASTGSTSTSTSAYDDEGYDY